MTANGTPARGYLIGGHWSPPDVGTREHRALSWLAAVELPVGIVLPASLWVPAARASGLSVHQVKRLARSAADGGDGRVGWYAEHLGRLRRRIPRGPADLARARQAHRIRGRGLSWPRIARLLGYASDRTARGMARRFAERLGAEPSIEYFESPVIVDNDAGAISIAA